MQHYQLLIECTDGVWRNADLGSDSPAMTYAMMDIAEIRDRRANYSQSLALPKTPHNCRIFEHINSKQTENGIYRQFLNARLFADHQPLASKGGVVKLLSQTATAFNVQLLGAAINIFDQLKKIDLATEYENAEDDPLGVIQVPWLPNPIIGEKYKTRTGLAYGCGHTSTDALDGVWIRQTPAIRINAAIESICNKLGYNFASDYDDSNAVLYGASRKGWKNRGDALPITATETGYINVINTSYYNFNVTDTATFYQFYAKTDGKKLIPFVDIVASVTETTNASKPSKNPLVQNIRSMQGIQSGEIALFVQSTDSRVPDYPVNKYSEGNSALWKMYQYFEPATGSWSVTKVSDTEKKFTKRARYYFDETIKILNGDKWDVMEEGEWALDWWKNVDNCVVRVGYSHNGEGVEISAQCGLAGDYEDAPMPRGLFSLSNNSGFSTAEDLFKWYLQTFALMMDVDYNTKTIRFKNHSAIYANKAVAKDWTEKLSKDTESESYELGSYAQTNRILLQANSKTSRQDMAVFTIANETLEQTKDIATLSIESQKAAEVLYFEKDEDGKIVYKANKCPSLVCLDTDENARVSTEDIPTTAIIPQAYAGIVLQLQDPRVISAHFWLTAADIAEFNPFVPIYLSQYGAYFYVNKINNYIQGKLTEVELVKL